MATCEQTNTSNENREFYETLDNHIGYLIIKGIPLWYKDNKTIKQRIKEYDTRKQNNNNNNNKLAMITPKEPLVSGTGCANGRLNLHSMAHPLKTDEIISSNDNSSHNDGNTTNSIENKKESSENSGNNNDSNNNKTSKKTVSISDNFKILKFHLICNQLHVPKVH